MPEKKKTIFDLGKREREIYESVLDLGEASVGDVLESLKEPPNYSTVRTILGQLVRKKVLSFRDDGGKYLYRANTSKESAQKSALRNLVSTLFYGNASDAVVALLDVAGDSLAEEDLKRIREKIRQTSKEKSQ